VPIKTDTPEDRVIRILEQTRLDALIADQAGLNMLSDRVLENAPKRILFGPNAKPTQMALEFKGINFESFTDLSDMEPDRPATRPGDALAYIIFTSGTTGTPKGLTIENESVCQFIEIMHQRFSLRAEDRILRTTEFALERHHRGHR